MVFAALGAAELLAHHPQDGPSRDLLRATVTAIGPIRPIPRGRGRNRGSATRTRPSPRP